MNQHFTPEVEHRHLWDREYRELNVIPSSTRTSPSKPLLLYEGLLNLERFTPVLDAGCGNGRNAIYLAAKGCKVRAVDFSDVALTRVRQRAAAAGVLENVSTENLTLGGHWSLPDDHFALVLDSYVFCHVIDRAEQENYRRQLRRVMQPSGMLYSAVFCTDDEYYREAAGLNIGDRVVLDTHNGIRKYLYTEEEFRNFFSSEFRVVYFTKFQFDDTVLGRKYRRSILTLLLEK